MDVELGKLVTAIEAHFAAHPNAADTAEGIAAWWITSDAVHPPLRRVEQALAILVESGLVRSRHIASGAVIYSRNAEPG